MKAHALILLTVLAATALGASACVSMQAPQGYAVHEHFGYEMQAVSTEASVVALNRFHNQDEERGDLAFWTEAARKHLVRSRGYAFVKEGKFTCPKGPGRWMLFSSRHKGAEHLYLLGLVVDGEAIFAMEGGGEKAVFEADVDKVIQAFASLD